MAPPPLPLGHCAPRHVTEDTPPDLLEGTMDLEVTLPNGKTVIMNVHRSTPMMDLLVQVTTAHRINPGGHVIQVISDNIFLTYKPSTPIGTLDTSAIKIVAKNKINEMANIRKSNLQQQAIERNIRLKPKEWVYKQQLVVNLPHNQLAVYRVPPKALISDIFSMVCEDKNLDTETHEIRHPVNVDERLRASCSLSDYQLQEVCVVSSDFRPPPLSVTDLITMSSIAHPEDKKRRGFLGLFSRKAKSSTGDSSVSSGSAEERSVSPARSDESTEGRPTPLANSPASSSGTLTNFNHTTTLATTSHHSSMTSINSTARLSRPVSMISLNKTKKRPAPVPPRRERRSDLSTSKGQANGKVKASAENRVSLSRHSSDSSGYHESDARSSHTSPCGSEVSSIEASRSVVAPPATNLTTVPSNSSLSVSSCLKGKRKAPSPPKPCTRNGIGSTAIPESPEEREGSPSSNHTSKNDSSLAQELELSKSLSVEDSSESNSSSLKRTSSPDVCEVVHKDLKEKERHISASSSPDSESKGHIDNVSRFSPSPFEKDKHLTAKPRNAETNGEAVVDPSVEPTPVGTPKPPPRDRSVSPAPPVTSEHEVQTRTVSLSSETSSTSLEMVNPRDIQRPRRHKRKKIPEEFLRNTSLKDSSSSSEQRKNFERVDESEENEIGHSTVHPEVRNGKVDQEEPEARITENCQDDLNNGSLHSKTTSDDSEASPHSSMTEEENKNIFSEDSTNVHEDEVDRNSTTEAYNEVVREVSNPSVMYVEMLDQEESSTDPPSIGEKQKMYTSKVQLSLVDNQKNNTRSSSNGEFKVPAPVTRPSSLNTSSKPIPKTEISPEDVIAELKSAIVSPDELQPRILNFKPKGKDWNVEKPSDYNVVLSFGTTTDPSAPKRSNSSSLERKVLTRTSSTSSYESADSGVPKVEPVQIRNSRSSTETSYESAPPPIPESRVPISSDTDSKASSVAVSRQSSFSDSDSREFLKPRAPAFSISTYQSRASKVSYDKKLSRSESLSSFKDLHQNDDEKKIQVEGKVMSLTRSDSQKNQAFRSDELKKKSTSTTFLNLNLSDGSDSIVRPSMLKSQARNLFTNTSSSSKRSPDGSIQFELSSSKEPVTFNRPVPNTFNNLRKAKSTFDIRGPEGRVPEGFEAGPDSGLANEYMRLQDDFVKWQQQLLQNQRVLHNRVAPIASNPPALNSVGMVNNMMNQQSQNQQPQQPRKPVEITIPIRFEDSDEDEKTPPVKPSAQPTQSPQSNVQRRSGPSVPVGAWQERPINVARVQQPPEVMGPSQPPEMQRQFGKQPAMQTVYHSAPQGRQQPVPQNNFQQMSQPGFQQMPSNNFQQMPQSNFQQMPMSTFQQVPQSTFQQHPQSGYQQMPLSSFQQQAPPQPSYQKQAPQSNFQQQVPQSSFQQQMPQSNFQQFPQSNFQQIPPASFQQMPQSGYQGPQPNFQQPSQPSYQQMPPASFQQVPQSSFQHEQPTSQHPIRNQQPTVQAGPRVQGTSNNVVNAPNDDNINARFSSVVTLSNDQNGQNAQPKDKVRSVVQLNNAEASTPVQGRQVPAPYSKVVPGANREAESGEGERRSPPNSSGVASVAPISSRLVQQAVQQPMPGGGSRISPPRIDRQPSPSQHEPSPPFAGVKLRPVETRISPPKVAPVPSPPSPPSAGPAPPPPPPPPTRAPPPPPPPPMSDEERRTSTGKKIFSAANVPQLDAREELMMAIRQFGGSGNLRKSPHPALH